MTTSVKRHRHEQSMWLIAGGAWWWCYQCGAVRLSPAYSKEKTRWDKPSGIGGANPAAMEWQPTRRSLKNGTK